MAGIINPHFIVMQVDDELSRSAGKNPLLARRLAVLYQPEEVDQFFERRCRMIEIAPHVRPDSVHEEGHAVVNGRASVTF